MKPIDLSASPLAAAIRARPAPPAMIVWVHRPERGTWCVLRRANGGRVILLCCDWTPGNEPVHILTSAVDGDGPRRPHNTCPACETELAAGTPGAAVAVEPEPPAPVVSRTVTPNLRRPAVELDVEALGGPDGGSFDHLEDLREWEER